MHRDSMKDSFKSNRNLTSERKEADIVCFFVAAELFKRCSLVLLILHVLGKVRKGQVPCPRVQVQYD